MSKSWDGYILKRSGHGGSRKCSRIKILEFYKDILVR